MTTVNPATPGKPSETSYDSLLKESVENEAAKQKQSSNKSLAGLNSSRESNPKAAIPLPKLAKKDKPSTGKLHCKLTSSNVKIAIL